MSRPRTASLARNRFVSASALVLSVVSTPCLADMIDIVWDTAGRFAGARSVAPGKFIEACTRLQSGTKVRWTFNASAAVDFNVHYHAGNDVVFPSKLTAATRGADLLRVEADQDFCWMWTNTSRANAEVTFALQR